MAKLFHQWNSNTISKAHVLKPMVNYLSKVQANYLTTSKPITKWQHQVQFSLATSKTQFSLAQFSLATSKA